MTSLNHSNNLCLVTLDCPTNSASGSVDYYCKSQETEIQKAKKEIENCKNDSDEESKKEKELKKLQSGLEEHIAKDHSLDESTRSNKIKEVNEQKDFVEKFNKDINNALNDGSNNILTHLCSGLETFLGFNSETRGYDGSGIVYSDLDRLCDGVMAFLHGVLKDVSEKQPYSVGKDILETLINDVLKPKLSTGRKGFEVIAQVARTVGEYNESVKNSNKKISDPIAKLKNEMKELKNQVCKINTDNSAQVTDFTSEKQRVDKELKKCIDNGQLFCTNINDNSKYVADLHSGCRNKVEIALKNITHEGKRLYTLAEKERLDLKDMDETISSTLEQLRVNVNHQIRVDVEAMVDHLKGLVSNIRHKLVDINKQLTKYVIDLEKWMTDAKKYIDEVVLIEVDKILQEVKEDKKSDSRLRLEEAAESIKIQASGIYESGKAAKEQVKAQVEKALNTVKAMDDMLKGDLYAVREKIKKRVIALKKEVSGLDQNVRDGLWTLKKSIHDLKKRVNENADDNNNLVKNELCQLSNSRKGLCDIATPIMHKTYRLHEMYKNEFNEKFEQLAEALQNAKLEEFKQKLETHSTKFESYASALETISKIGDPSGAQPQSTQREITQLVNEVNEGIRTITEKYTALKSSGTFMTVGRFSDAVKKACGAINTLGSKLMEEIRQAKSIIDVYKNGAEISGAIEKLKTLTALRETLYGSGGKSNDHREGGLALTIEGLYNHTKVIYDVIARFYNNAKYQVKHAAETAIDAASKKLENGSDGKIQLGSKLMDEFNSAYGNIKNHLSKNLDDEIEAQLPTDFAHARTVLISKNSDGFKNYSTYINQPVTWDKLPSGTLPDAINNVTTQVLATLSGIESFNNSAAEMFNDVITKLTDMCRIIDGHGYYTKTLLNYMKDDTIEQKLKAIKDYFHRLQNVYLIDVIGNADNFINNDADAICKSTVDNMVGSVDNQISSALSTLTTAARRNYVTSVKSFLTAFADKVEKELQPLPGEIERDLTIGFKGLMKTIQGITYNVKENVSPTFDDKSSTTLFDEISQLARSFAPSPKGSAYLDNFTKLSTNFHKYFTNIHTYINHQISPESKTQSPTEDPNVQLLTDVNSNFNKLLDHLKKPINPPRTYVFDNTYTKKHESLSSSLHLLSPSHFANPRHPELLDAVKKGLQGFVDEMGKVYVNGYDGHKEKVDMEKLVDTEGNTDGKLTDDGRNLSKVFLTILETLYYNFHKFITSYASDNTQQIHSGLISKLGAKSSNNGKGQEKITNPLGVFFSERGYKVPSDADKQDGELQRSDKMTVKEIKDFYFKVRNGLTEGTIKVLGNYANAKEKSVTLNNLLIFFYQTVLFDYYKTCHLNIRPNPKPPTTIYEMLHWLNGLYYNPIYPKLEQYMRQWFNGCLKGYKIEEKDFSVALPHRRSWRMQRSLTYKEMHQVFTNSTIRANWLLIVILGHGQADGRYACDFLTNPDGLLYPSNPDTCLDLLVEVCLRVNHQIRFLYKQCHNGPSCGGWRECWYGKGVGGPRWQCNDLQCANQEGDQKHKQTCDQECDQKAECGLKSPLQSFLEDGLPGFLPHPFSKTSCTITCDLPNHFGKPCLTPMGFTDLGLKASHRQTGKRIKDVLENFCGTGNESLNLFCAYMVLLLRRPPQTLCDMFTFYYNLLDHWCDEGDQKQHRREAFKGAVAKANFGRPFDELNPTSLFRTAVHNSTGGASSQSTHDRGDLFSLVSCDNNANPVMPCGRYLQSIGDDIRLLYFEKHAAMYLSWIVYQAETFYDLLDKLYKEVCGNCEKSGDPCFGSRCDKECKVQHPLTAEALKAQPTVKHNDKCKSIVHCSNTHQVLFKYGFTFGSPHDLGGYGGVEKKRTCKDFCAALKSVLNKEKKAEAALAKLIYDTIPKFLWEIRQPFSYLVLALWSASFLYLIYVMVGRLDVLHIRSHLRIPSSHRITAQSLLAAAQVGRLAKISYLQP